MVQQFDSTPETKQFSSLTDPHLVNAARHIYQKCCETNPEKAEQTYGVAIDRETYRGQLIFKEKPTLLPWESFIPSDILNKETST